MRLAVPQGGGKTATVAKGWGRRAGGPQAAGCSFTRASAGLGSGITRYSTVLYIQIIRQLAHYNVCQLLPFTVYQVWGSAYVKDSNQLHWPDFALLPHPAESSLPR